MNQEELNEIGRRGRELYEQTLRAKVEPENKGRYLVLNIETGDYAIGDEALPLSTQVRALSPAGQLYALRIGYPTFGRIGHGLGVQNAHR